MPLGRARATVTSILASRRTAITASPRPAPAISASNDHTEPVMTNSISTRAPPAVPKWRGQIHGRSLLLRSSTPASRGTSRVERLAILVSESASRIMPSSSSAEFSLRRSRRRAISDTEYASSAATTADPANRYSGCAMAPSQMPACCACSQPNTKRVASTA